MGARVRSGSKNMIPIRHLSELSQATRFRCVDRPTTGPMMTSGLGLIKPADALESTINIVDE